MSKIMIELPYDPLKIFEEMSHYIKNNPCYDPSEASKDYEINMCTTKPYEIEIWLNKMKSQLLPELEKNDDDQEVVADTGPGGYEMYILQWRDSLICSG